MSPDSLKVEMGAGFDVGGTVVFWPGGADILVGRRGGTVVFWPVGGDQGVGCVVQPTACRNNTTG